MTSPGVGAESSMMLSVWQMLWEAPGLDAGGGRGGKSRYFKEADGI